MQQNCTYTTPVLTSCAAYNVTIYNSTGASVRSTALTLINASVYKFTFNASRGTYAAVLCDNSTREIVIAPDNDMMLALLGSVLALIAFLFVLPFMWRDEERVWTTWIRHLCIMFGVVLFTTIPWLAQQFAQDAGNTALASIFQQVWMFSLGFFTLVFFFYIILIVRFIIAGFASINKNNEVK